MNALPGEVIDLIVRRITSKEDLCNVRLVSRFFSVPATRKLFFNQHIILPALDENPTELNHLQNIASSPTLSTAVRSVLYTTSLDPNKNLDDYDNEEEATEFSPTMAKAIQLVNRFPKVSTLGVEFAYVCATEDPEDYAAIDPEEPILFRTKVLKSLFSALNHPAYPTASLQSLSLKNLQNVNDKDLVHSQNFLQVLTRISELRLKIVNEQDKASPGTCWSHPELYSFFAQLPQTWLQPTRHTLTHLTLHSDFCWGYLPKVDFRSLHFPKLKSLELGNYTFTHNWQLEWILTHGPTLEELILDDCPIIRHIQTEQRLDQDMYAADPPNSTEGTSKWRYDGRWADYFRRIEEGLIKLTTFKFGAGEWSDGLNFDRVQPLQIGLHPNLYMAFNDAIGPSPWIERRSWNAISVPERVDIDAQEENRTDKAAYESLMATVAKRQKNLQCQ